MERRQRQLLLKELTLHLGKATSGGNDLDCLLQKLCKGLLGNDTFPSEVKAEPPPFSTSVTAAIELTGKLLPGWRWHVGYGVKGIFPYACVTSPKGTRYEADAPTVPLALLKALSHALGKSSS